MRYHNHPNSDWLISHRPKRQTEKLPMPFYMSTSVFVARRGPLNVSSATKKSDEYENNFVIRIMYSNLRS